MCLLPGLVNAHAHLELSEFKGLVPGDRGFGAWVAGLLAEKQERGEASLVRGAELGLEELLASGTTTVGDIASSPALLAAVGRIGRALRPRVRVYREVLDAWDSRRTAQALALVEESIREGERLFEGFSPHAPFTVSRELLAGLARIKRRRERPVCMHWSETEAELTWLREGSGPLAGVLGPSPKMSGLELLDEAGLLGPGTTLVHGNLPAPGEPERIAASGASLVHCPGTHAFFGRGRFPIEQYRGAGVNLALGTDSLASNDSLDLRGEARRLLRREPWLSPQEVLAMATEGGARALGLGGRVGRLEPGAFADAVSVPMASVANSAKLDDLVASLFAAEEGPAQVFLGGRPGPRLA